MITVVTMCDEMIVPNVSHKTTREKAATAAAAEARLGESLAERR